LRNALLQGFDVLLCSEHFLKILNIVLGPLECAKVEWDRLDFLFGIIGLGFQVLDGLLDLKYRLILLVGLDNTHTHSLIDIREGLNFLNLRNISLLVVRVHDRLNFVVKHSLTLFDV